MSKSYKLEKIVSREENFANWYTSVVNQAELILYSNVKGFMIFQPNGWAIWENIKNILDKEFKKLDIKNVYMPFLIPVADFEKEKDHIEGFSPELFTITKIGDKNLDSPLAVRPTSEILFCNYFENKLNSYKDLPMKLNQWTSVLRAEKTTKPFLRNSEFHWHETHAIFEDHKSAYDFSVMFLNLYADFFEKELCIPVVKGEKTINERFSGADVTLTIETIMQDGQALQSATSHLLGENFTKPFNIKFQDKDNKVKHPFSTSHGLSTRVIGALIMVHADDNGLILPPAVAPNQIAILPLFIDKFPVTLEKANEFKDLFSDFRTFIDKSDKGMGSKIATQEINGTPISIIIGPKDIENNNVTVYRRDLGTKTSVAIKDIKDHVLKVLEEYKVNLYSKAKNRLDNSIVDCKNIEQLKEILDNKKWARAYFSGEPEDEIKIKELTGATARCIVKEEKEEKECFFSKKKTKKVVIFARSY